MLAIIFALIAALTVPDSGKYIFFIENQKVGVEEFTSTDSSITSHVELNLGRMGHISMDVRLEEHQGLLKSYRLVAHTSRGMQKITLQRKGKRFLLNFSAGGFAKEETLETSDPHVMVVDNNVISTFNAFARKLRSDSSVVIVPQALSLFTVKKLSSGYGELSCCGRAKVLRKWRISFGNRIQQDLYFSGDTLVFVYQPTGDVKISLNGEYHLPRKRFNFKRKNFSIKSDGVKIRGEVDLPVRSKPVGIVLLIPGSGRVDRHELGIFDDIAQCLTNAGFAAARYDKRGVGKSSGKYEEAGLSDLEYDAINVAKYLRKKYKGLPLFILGHSEGGMYSFIVARKAGASGVIALAAPCRNLKDVIALQLVRMGFIDSSSLDSIRERINVIADSLAKVEKASGMVSLPIIGKLPARWFKEHALLEPDTLVKGWKGPTLLIAGSNDLHVPPEDVRPYEELLKRNGSTPGFVVLKGENHFFENRELLCKTIMDWLKRQK